MIGREELGKAELLKDLWLKIEDGDTVTTADVEAVCGSLGHLDKHKAVRGGVTTEGYAGHEAGEVDRGQVCRTIEN